VLADAGDAVHRGLCPGWQVIYDRIRLEMVTGQSRQTSRPSLAEAAFLHGLASAQCPERMWVVT
jgi:hypothetical protein